MKRILLVTAHPDDESAGFGGSLLVSRDRGIETHLLCLTTGQAARHRGTAKDDAELGQMRKAELAAACKILKINHCNVLDYPDGQLFRQDLSRVAGDIAREIRRIRPDVVLTFGPEGSVTGHPDHAMASIFTTVAFHWAARDDKFNKDLENGLKPYQAKKLYYLTSEQHMADRPPVALSPTTTTVDIGKYLDTKIEAFRAHTTQLPLADKVAATLRDRGDREIFHLAAQASPGPVKNEADLFDGIEGQ